MHKKRDCVHVECAVRYGVPSLLMMHMACVGAVATPVGLSVAGAVPSRSVSS